MAKLGDLVDKVRSKNAGPFWLTIDVFCGDRARYEQVSRSLHTEAVARLFGTPSQTLRRFDVEDLNVVKFSFPRPAIQGTRPDRDMHGASWANLLAELDLATRKENPADSTG